MDAPTIFGICPILYAFFDAAGRVDRSAMRRQLDACVVGGGRDLPLLRQAGHGAPPRSREGARPPAGAAAHPVRPGVGQRYAAGLGLYGAAG